MKLDNKSQDPKIGGVYAHYVLFVLLIVFIFNFIDRNILAILSQDIQEDLGIGDAEMGFLYGTVFALFYAVFGIPLARFADVWRTRRRSPPSRTRQWGVEEKKKKHYESRQTVEKKQPSEKFQALYCMQTLYKNKSMQQQQQSTGSPS